MRALYFFVVVAVCLFATSAIPKQYAPDAGCRQTQVSTTAATTTNTWDGGETWDGGGMWQ